MHNGSRHISVNVCVWIMELKIKIACRKTIKCQPTIIDKYREYIITISYKILYKTQRHVGCE